MLDPPLYRLKSDVEVNFNSVLGRSTNSVVYSGVLLEKKMDVAVKFMQIRTDLGMVIAKQQYQTQNKHTIPMYGAIKFAPSGVALILKKAAINMRSWRKRYAEHAPLSALLQVASLLLSARAGITNHGNLSEQNVLFLHDRPFVTDGGLVLADYGGMSSDAHALGALLFLLFLKHDAPHLKDVPTPRFSEVLDDLRNGRAPGIPHHFPEPVSGAIRALWDDGSPSAALETVNAALHAAGSPGGQLSRTLPAMGATVSPHMLRLFSDFELPSGFPMRQLSKFGVRFCEFTPGLLPARILDAVLRTLRNMVCSAPPSFPGVAGTDIKRVAVFQSQSAAVGLISRARGISSAALQSPQLFKQIWRERAFTVRSHAFRQKNSEIALREKMHSLFRRYMNAAGEALGDDIAPGVALVPLIRGCSDFDTALKIGSTESRDLALLDDGFIGAGLYYSHDIAYASKYAGSVGAPTRAYLVEVAPVRDVFPVISMNFRGQPLVGSVEAHYSRVARRGRGRISYYPVKSPMKMYNLMTAWKEGRAEPFAEFDTFSEVAVPTGSTVPLFAIELRNIFEQKAAPGKAPAPFVKKGEPVSTIAAQATGGQIRAIFELPPKSSRLRLLAFALKRADISSVLGEESAAPLNLRMLLEGLTDRELAPEAAYCLSLCTALPDVVQSVYDEASLPIAHLLSAFNHALPGAGSFTLGKTLWTGEPGKRRSRLTRFVMQTLKNLAPHADAKKIFYGDGSCEFPGFVLVTSVLEMSPGADVIVPGLQAILGFMRMHRPGPEEAREVFDKYAILPAVVCAMTTHAQHGVVVPLALLVLLSFTASADVRKAICKNMLLPPSLVATSGSDVPETRLNALRVLVNITAHPENAAPLMTGSYSLLRDILELHTTRLFKRNAQGVFVCILPRETRYVSKIVFNVAIWAAERGTGLEREIRQFFTLCLGCAHPDLPESAEIVELSLRSTQLLGRAVHPPQLPLIIKALRVAFATHEGIMATIAELEKAPPAPRDE
eukprot:gnl/Chilomastix_cuspidata/4511.p2 GENE.gnl/Chilomastix_cuspidata/4511~~gnl/Chilomastix_cuspidata/4511.p2  ORF type:complete len:1007 (+),score=352.43 gnl/Chilomastix_cuspidata/4511:3519-6539(+)